MTRETSRPLAELFKDTQLNNSESLVNQIYHILWRLITTAQLLPGELLSEKELAVLLNASRTPVREALIRLEDARLVKVVPKSGTYVTPIRISTYIEACFIRLQLEIGAVRRAAKHSAMHTNIVDLNAIIEQQAAAFQDDDYPRFFMLDEKLHESFFQLAGIAGVWNVLRRTQSEVYRIRHLKREYQLNHASTVLVAHQRIVDSILAADPDAAEAALIEHLQPLENEIAQLAAYPELLEFIEQQSTDYRRPKRRSE